MSALDRFGDLPWHFYLLAVSSSPEQDINGLTLSSKARKKGKALEPFSHVQSSWEMFKFRVFFFPNEQF